jgi:hypothetical protein
MYTNIDRAENFETLLMSEFDSQPKVSARLGEDDFDAGYRVVSTLLSDLALDSTVLDFDELM